MNRTKKVLQRPAGWRRSVPAVGTTAALLFGLATLYPSDSQAQYPTTPPPAGELRPLQFPEFQEVTLGNGFQLVVVENKRLPIVSISFNFEAGSRYDPPGLEGSPTPAPIS